MRERRLLQTVGALLLAGYALWVLHHRCQAVGGSDSSGYFNAARLYASGRVAEPMRGTSRLGLSADFDPVFIPLGYSPGPRPGKMAPSYPPGFPLHVAAAAFVGGWGKAPFFVGPLAGLACLVLIYALGRELGLPRGFALAGSGLLGLSPLFVFMEVQPMSDVPATAWAIAAVFCAYRSRARPGLVWPAAAGAAFAVGVLIRPTNLLLLVALVIALAPRVKTWLAFAAGGLPFAAALLAYNAAAFGNPWSSGYGGILEGGLAWSNFPARARHYGYWIGRVFSPVVPLGWLALLAGRRASRRDRAVLLTWFGAFFLFYSFYDVYDAWWYSRFLLPGAPALVLGALLVTRDLLFNSGRPRFRGAVPLAAALFVTALAFGLQYMNKERVHKIYKGERIYPDACAMADRRLPPNGLLLSMQMSGALHYYTDRTYAMWNWLLPERFATLRASTESRGYRWYALLAPFEVEHVRKIAPGDWRAIDRVRDVELWELLPAWSGAFSR